MCRVDSATIYPAKLRYHRFGMMSTADRFVTIPVLPLHYLWGRIGLSAHAAKSQSTLAIYAPSNALIASGFRILKHLLVILFNTP